MKVRLQRGTVADVVSALAQALKNARREARSMRRSWQFASEEREVLRRKLEKLGVRLNPDVEGEDDDAWIVEPGSVAEKPNALALELLPVLQQHSGERGEGETALQTLRRIIAERDESARLVSLTMVSEPEAPAPRRSRKKQ